MRRYRFLSDRGYGIYIDTARYITVYFASHTRTTTDVVRQETADSVEELYAADNNLSMSDIVVDIPAADCVRLFVFGGPDMRTALQHYNLFSGGGTVPPLWGLGVWYTHHFVVDGQYTLNDPARTQGLTLSEYRYGVCMNLGKGGCEFFGWTQLTEGDVYLCPRCRCTAGLQTRRNG